jgi:hypothetical protein
MNVIGLNCVRYVAKSPPIPGWTVELPGTKVIWELVKESPPKAEKKPLIVDA